MKAKEVLSLLNITRPTLTKYVKTGLVKVDSLINGQYNYNEESIKRLLNNEYNDHLVRPIKTNENDKKIKELEEKLDDVVKVLSNTNYILTQLGLLRLLDPNSLNRLKENKEVVNTMKESNN